MVAHIISVTKQYPDPRTMGPFGQGVEETLARYGGRYQSALRHRVATLEGDWHPPKGVVILEFPSYEQALAWYHSPEYAPLRELLMATGRFDVILVDGMSDADPGIGRPHDAWKSERIAELEAEAAQAAQDQQGGATGSC